jgi:hypothetical protein
MKKKKNEQCDWPNSNNYLVNHRRPARRYNPTTCENADNDVEEEQMKMKMKKKMQAKRKTKRKRMMMMMK